MPIRIFHLVPNMNYGGLQEVVRGLALCQSRSGHSVTVGCWTNVGNHPEAERDLEQAGVRVIYLRRASDGGLAFGRRSLFRSISKHVGAAKADILHVHNPFDYYLYGATAARVAGGTKVVQTLHATIMFDAALRKAAGATPLKITRTKAGFWAAAMLTDKVVSVCSEAERILRGQFVLPGKKLCVVDNGIDVAPFLAVPPRNPRSDIVFGAVGRMSFEKNHRLLIEAFAEARRNHRNIRLRLLGGGPLELNLKEHARRLGVSDVVEFCGFSNDVARFLGDLDVFVLPSVSEGLPMSLLEAIASGLPVVATDVGGVPGVVQSTNSGWLCPSNNIKAMKGALESAIGDIGRWDRGERARRLVAERYSVERMTRDYDAVYQKILQ